jgi:hypothetical protein
MLALSPAQQQQQQHSPPKLSVALRSSHAQVSAAAALASATTADNVDQMSLSSPQQHHHLPILASPPSSSVAAPTTTTPTTSSTGGGVGGGGGHQFRIECGTGQSHFEYNGVVIQWRKASAKKAAHALVPTYIYVAPRDDTIHSITIIVDGVHIVVPRATQINPKNLGQLACKAELCMCLDAE